MGATRIGTWDTGPFDNDDAADWCGLLDQAQPDARPGMVRAALADATVEGDYLESPVASVASQRAGGPPLESEYAPEFLTNGGYLDLPEELAPLAVRALDRIVGEKSEWRELWDDTGESDDALAAVAATRAALSQ